MHPAPWHPNPWLPPILSHYHSWWQSAMMVQRDWRGQSNLLPSTGKFTLGSSRCVHWHALSDQIHAPCSQPPVGATLHRVQSTTSEVVCRGSSDYMCKGSKHAPVALLVVMQSRNVRQCKSEVESRSQPFPHNMLNVCFPMQPLPLVSASRHLVKKGHVIELKQQDRLFGRTSTQRRPVQLFSFNDLVIVCKKKKAYS